MRLSVISAVIAGVVMWSAMMGTGRLEVPEAGFLFRSIKVGQEQFKYAVYIPRGYDAQGTDRWPAIVFLHGSGECGRDGQKQLAVGLPVAVMLNADRWPCIMVIPQKPEQGKQWEDYDAPVMAMLAAAQKEWRVDADRVYLTGLSQGGHGTWTIGAAHPDTFAAIVPVCGYYRGTKPADLAQKLKGTPTWTFHGDADAAVPVEQSNTMHAAIVAARGLKADATDPDAKLTIYPGVGHNSWDKAYADKELADWIFKHRRAR